MVPLAATIVHSPCRAAPGTRVSRRKKNTMCVFGRPAPTKRTEHCSAVGEGRKGLQSCHGTTAPTNHIPAGGRRRRVFAVWAAGTLLRIAGEPFWAPRRANLTLHYTRRWMGRSIQAPLSFPPVKSRVGFIPCFSFLSRALSLRFARP